MGPAFPHPLSHFKHFKFIARSNLVDNCVFLPATPLVQTEYLCEAVSASVHLSMQCSCAEMALNSFVYIFILCLFLFSLSHFF